MLIVFAHIFNVRQLVDCNIFYYTLLILVSRQVGSETLCIFIISTYANCMPPESAIWFYKYITESSQDCRVPKHLLAGLQYTIFGLGNSSYGTDFNTVCMFHIYLRILYRHFTNNSLEVQLISLKRTEAV